MSIDSVDKGFVLQLETSGSAYKRKRPNVLGLKINCELVDDTYKNKQHPPKKFQEDSFESILGEIDEVLDKVCTSSKDAQSMVHSLVVNILKRSSSIYEHKESTPLILDKLNELIRCCAVSGINEIDLKTLQIASRAFERGGSPVEGEERLFLGSGGFATVHQVKIIEDNYAEKKIF